MGNYESLLQLGNTYSKLLKTDPFTAQQRKSINATRYIKPKVFKISSMRKISKTASMGCMLPFKDLHKITKLYPDC